MYRRRRAAAGTVLVALLAGIVAAGLALTSGGGPSIPTGGRAVASGNLTAKLAPAAAEAGVLPWSLAAPISRESLVSVATNELELAGGLVGSSSQDAVFRLGALSGTLTEIGVLPVATHDAAALELGGRLVVVGGGSAAPAGEVQALGASPHGVRTATLPVARADATSVVIGSTGYIVGGYAGASGDAEVLATSDGTTFRNVARLAVPVRYPAVAAVGGRIYVFGGMSVSGTPQDTIQVVDPATRSSRVIGRLPVPLAGASAGSLAGAVYLAGGQGPSGAQSTVYAFVPRTGKVLRAGALPVAVAYAGSAVSGGRLFLVGGEGAGGVQLASAQVVEPNAKFGTAGSPAAGSPFFGDQLLIADRGNDRLLLISDTGRIVWRFPSASAAAPPTGFYFPDDAFFANHGHEIISNQEENETVVILSYPSGKVLWSYGHPRQKGSAPGYLNTPDDAYLLRDGEITVADPGNCRVLFIDVKTKAVVHQIGTSDVCVHAPPTEMTSPNGDTPLADGNVLVSEIGGSYIDEYTPRGRLVWSVQLPSVSYVSDPQQLAADRYLVADYALPGAFVEFDRAGKVVYRYAPTSGPDELDHPSLVEQLPSGVLMANDDYNDRVVAIDPATGAKVWQYGVTRRPGTAPGLLNTPDGFDLLAPGGATPTHPATG